jgi:branched-chain amino acid transport system ATP-binding protein
MTVKSEGVRVDDLSVNYGEVRALTGVSFELAAGECLAVLGPNGAGKSTLGKALACLLAPASGTIRYGEMVAANEGTIATPAYRLARQGVAYVPEGRGIFPGLTVQENITLGARTIVKGERASAEESAFSLFAILDRRRRQIAGTLSGGEQQMLALARALMTARRVLIADELSLCLAPLLIETIYEALSKARTNALTMILIEQYVERAFSLADRALVLKRGEVAWQGSTDKGMMGVVEEYLS